MSPADVALEGGAAWREGQALTVDFAQLARPSKVEGPPCIRCGDLAGDDGDWCDGCLAELRGGAKE